VLHRLVVNWVYGGTLAGLLLFALAPLITSSWSVALGTTFLLLPAYMVHQYEEHDDDRFRRFVNETIGQGRDVLSPRAVFVINVPGVWGVIAASLYLAAAVNIGFALVAAYLTIVNAAVHVMPALIRRRYNPGTVTALVLFVPLGTLCLWRVQLAGGGTVAYHLFGLVTAIGIHAAIVIHVLRERQRQLTHGRGSRPVAERQA
jgi:hypothetical protein